MIQLIGIRHHGSNIRQAIFVEGAMQATTYHFQSIPPSGWGTPAVHRTMDHAEVMDTLRIWREGAAEGDTQITHEDSITMRRVAGVDHLEMVTGAAPSMEEAA